MYISLSRRSGDTMTTSSTTYNTLIVVLLALIFSSVVLAGVYSVLRRQRKRAKRAAIVAAAAAGGDSHTLTINTSRYSTYDEKHGLITTSSPISPTIPEITITFPDEEEPNGKRKSGRVVLVRVGEKSFGMEPLVQDAPPIYQHDSGRFQSIDLERVGGLKELH